MKKIISICVVLLLVSAVGFGQSVLKGRARFGGSTTIDPIVQAAIESFMKKHPEVKLIYEAEDSQVGISRLLAGEYALAGVSRNLTKEEKSRGLVEHLIAMDGVAVIVNKDVPLADLSLRQLANIFNGTSRNWKDLEGRTSLLSSSAERKSRELS